MSVLTILAAATMPPMVVEDRGVRPMDCRTIIIRTASRDGRPVERPRARGEDKPKPQRRCLTLASA